MSLLDEHQAGLRKATSTANVVQMMSRMQEDVVNRKRRVNVKEANGMDGDDWQCAKLLDVRKAYPRVNKPALWMLLESYGMRGKCREIIMDLHDTTDYKLK